ncbi:MAG: septal ring lytic transglycosylase RlpA family protein [Alphaproteobacteria bacterium]|nr:septal ring lytic transglycosylase RlpA family protein [Alphaproteobacteria bacterium]
MKNAPLMRTIVVLLVVLAIASCATEPTPKLGRYKVGTPYQIGGVWYYPKEEAFYDETGVASWYGSDFHGKATANGERYDMNTLTAAHRTLPLPSVVRVTNLDNGRSLRLRVNDRGPYAHGRIIDVSSRASELLGFQNRGTARVRVQYEGRGVVGAMAPADDDDISSVKLGDVRAAPRSQVASTPLAPPPGASASNPIVVDAGPAIISQPGIAANANVVETDGVVTTVSVPTSTQLWVQVGAFVTRGNADRLSRMLASVGPSQVSRILQNGRPLHRVRFGPFGKVEEADLMLDKVISSGQNGAQIIVE